MSWRAAFLRQATSENAIRRQLNTAQAEYSHQLHYLQMVTEKLAKGLLASPEDTNPPAPVHGALVRLLQSLKGQPHLRKQLGYNDPAIFRRFINSLLDLAASVEQLAPSAAGFDRANPEYPWRDKISSQVLAPIDFRFDAFDARNPQMIKLEALVGQLLILEQ